MFADEMEFVSWLRRLRLGQGRRVPLGIGDDAAVVGVTSGQDLLLTTDMTIENIHFTQHLHPARAVGHRALARSLSDIAAMGGTPRFALLSLAVSRQFRKKWLEEFYDGLLALARRLDVKLVGGDTAVVPSRTTIDVVVTGEVPRHRRLTRSGAQAGDQLFVSGRLGLSALGLLALREPSLRRMSYLRAARQAHLYPQPLCALGRFLMANRLASALIDLSDGLSLDLARLCEASGVGAELWSAELPLPQLPAKSGLTREFLLKLALHGGEDYQLLFTVPPGLAHRVPRRIHGVLLRQIGQINNSRVVTLVRGEGNEEVLPCGGYDHFRKP